MTTATDPKALIAIARESITVLRDWARTGGLHFKQRDRHVLALHKAIDALEALSSSASSETPQLDLKEFREAIARTAALDVVNNLKALYPNVPPQLCFPHIYLALMDANVQPPATPPPLDIERISALARTEVLQWPESHRDVARRAIDGFISLLLRDAPSPEERPAVVAASSETQEDRPSQRPEKTADDAPVELHGEARDVWALGFNAAMAEVYPDPGAREAKNEYAAVLLEVVETARPAFRGTPFRAALDKAKKLLEGES